MTSIKKTIVLACAASMLSFGVAMAQTDPSATPAPGAAPMSSDQGAAAPADDAGSKPMKKKMMKKRMSKKMMKKKMM